MSETRPDSRVPALRVRAVRPEAIRAEGGYVLYWMTAFRRTGWNFALQRAAEWARALRKPLQVLEALRIDYPWACDRFHHFVVQGMAGNAARLRERGVGAYAYLERAPGAGRGLLERLARDACVVVGDDHPGFFLPRMVRAAEARLRVRCEWVDSNGLLPLRAPDRVFARAFDFRRYLRRQLAPHLADFPAPDPLQGARLASPRPWPSEITRRWPPAAAGDLVRRPTWMDALPIDHGVPIVPWEGGEPAARRALRDFVRRRLEGYADRRNHPDEDGASRLSPWLHFGHLSAHEVVDSVLRHAGLERTGFGVCTDGRDPGGWGGSEDVEAFLDQLVTWRELGFNFAARREDGEEYGSLPAWAQRTLAVHAGDPRRPAYSRERLEAADTHDLLWNAAQRQLVREGRLHNYLRMLWGKKVLEWSATPAEAFETLVCLNNRYALDGRDPNSASGIGWCFGRYDRAWGPERPIFGTVRYMSSASTARKVRLKRYLERYGASC